MLLIVSLRSCGVLSRTFTFLIQLDEFNDVFQSLDVLVCYFDNLCDVLKKRSYNFAKHYVLVFFTNEVSLGQSKPLFPEPSVILEGAYLPTKGENVMPW